MKGLSTLGFLLLVMCLFLPFLTVSCQQQKITTFSGIELVVGKDLESAGRKATGEPLAMISFGFVLAGLLLTMIPGAGRALGVICSVGSLITLFMMKLKLENELARQGGGILRIDYEPGFYFFIFGLFVTAALSAISTTKSRTSSYPNDEVLSNKSREGPRVSCPGCRGPVARGAGYCGTCGMQLTATRNNSSALKEPMFCSGCGARQGGDSMFCDECGESLAV